MLGDGRSEKPPFTQAFDPQNVCNPVPNYRSESSDKKVDAHFHPKDG